jgi:DNA repair exonuclease SbcCD ATPase subunit
MKRLQRHLECPAAGLPSSEPGEYRVPPSAIQAYGTTALEAVHQAAELIRTIEAHAAEAEIRARAIVLQAIEDIKVAKARVLSAEEQWDSASAALEEADSRAQEIEDALRQLESQLADNELRLSEAELHAKTAEALANESERTLTCVEAAIRTHLLEQRPDASRDLVAAA